MTSTASSSCGTCTVLARWRTAGRKSAFLLPSRGFGLHAGGVVTVRIQAPLQAARRVGPRRRLHHGGREGGPRLVREWPHRALRVHYNFASVPPTMRRKVVLNRVIRWTGRGLDKAPRQAEKQSQSAGSPEPTPWPRRASDSASQKSRRTNFSSRGFTRRSEGQQPDLITYQRTVLTANSLPRRSVAGWPSRRSSHGLRSNACVATSSGCRGWCTVYLHRFLDVHGIEVYTDTDWGGCPRTRKSTSGGCVMLGSHLIKSWSSIQTSVALSEGAYGAQHHVRCSDCGLLGHANAGGSKCPCHRAPSKGGGKRDASPRRFGKGGKGGGKGSGKYRRGPRPNRFAQRPLGFFGFLMGAFGRCCPWMICCPGADSPDARQCPAGAE